MRYEWVIYSATGREGYFKLMEILETIPEKIKIEFIKDERLPIGDTFVEIHKTHIIEYLDKVFDIEKSKDVRKKQRIEIDRYEIPCFTHFYIGPQDLEIDREVFGDVIRPTCTSEICYIGSRLLRPAKIKVQKAQRLGIAEIGRGAWQKHSELVISAKLKKIFDQEGITGLSYEPMEFLDAESFSDIPLEPPYLATINNIVYQVADEIVVHKWACKKHSVIQGGLGGGFEYSNLRLQRETIPDSDFIELSGIKCKGRTYEYHINNVFYITRKTLELLLDHKIKGLTNLGFFIKTKFDPVIFANE